MREQRTAVLADDEILQLARWGAAIEAHYGQPMDIEWAKDGGTGEIHDHQAVTISGAEGSEGKVYEGELEFETEELKPEDLPKTHTKVFLNVASPEIALRNWRLPADGIGLARVEFIITNAIQIHPLALVRFDELKDATSRRKIRDLTRGYDDKSEYFVEQLALD